MSRDLKAYKNVSDDLNGQINLVEYMALVKRIAIHLKPRLPNYIETDDMVQIGMIGLMEAKSSFNASFGISFESFAKIRIRGTIIDEARRLSTITRLALQNKKRHEQGILSLAASLDRMPSNTEVANSLGLTINQYEDQRTHYNSFEIHELEQCMEDDGFDVEDENTSILDDIVSEENRNILNEAIKQLNDRNRIILSLYYVNEMNLKEIAAVIGVNESRISQILTATVKELKELVRNK